MTEENIAAIAGRKKQTQDTGLIMIMSSECHHLDHCKICQEKIDKRIEQAIDSHDEYNSPYWNA
jgi:hypothetical protein